MGCGDIQGGCRHACGPALEEGRCEGATPHHSIPEPVIEGAQACAANVDLTAIHPPLPAGHLPPQLLINKGTDSTEGSSRDRL